jgi:glutathione S-transferase
MNQGNTDGAAELKAHAQERVGVLLDQLDGELARHGGDWLLGGSFSLVDAYGLMLCRWTRNFSAAPARERVHLGAHMRRVLARPAVQRVFATEQLSLTDI